MWLLLNLSNLTLFDLLQYYLTPGGCKYGKFCRYSHPKDESEIVPPELNFAGLPIRLVSCISKL